MGLHPPTCTEAISWQLGSGQGEEVKLEKPLWQLCFEKKIVGGEVETSG